MKLTLYIDGREAALSSGSDEALILWTYTRDDAEAPAAVKNSYTKTITLPACDANDRIFSHAGTLDRVTAAGMFDALRRTPFIIYADDGRVLDRGYLKLDRVSRRGEVVLSYDVTLYGGLGGFFYDLTYNADGSKRTLGDMRWLTCTIGPSISDLIDLRDQDQDPGVPTLADGWADLLDGSFVNKATGILNYVPANNGIPDGNFDAGKAYYRPASGYDSYMNLEGIEMSKTEGGRTYTPSPAADGGVVLQLGAKHTEWEMQVFNAGQQRMAWNVARFLRSLEYGSIAGDFGEWKFYLDTQTDFFDEQNSPYFMQTWVTIEVPETSNFPIYSHFTGTKTPADYLLGFAKMFGLVFIVDEVAQTIVLTTRDAYYAGGYAKGVIDLSDRVDTHDEPAEVKPFLASARLYDFAAQTAGAFAEQYAARYGRTYGDFLLDSGLPFDAGTIDVMKSMPFKGAADVLESSPWYFVKPGSATSAPLNNYLKFVEYEEVTYLLYAGSESLKVQVPSFGGRRFPYNGVNYTGLEALPQFHDSDNRRIKAPDVMLFLVGKITLPNPSSITMRWFNNSTFVASELTGGKRIWNISPSSANRVTEVPLFQRYISMGQEFAHLEFGTPKEVADGHTPNQGDYYLYEVFWQSYMRDRFDRDTMVLDIRVNLAGLPAGPDLLRRFYYYRGSLWSLNKIEDYNPARPGLTRCEFVRVKQITNYTSGQTFRWL